MGWNIFLRSYMSFCTKLVCPYRGPVLFLSGACNCCCQNIVDLFWAWGLGTAQVWHLHPMLGWRQVSGHDISFFYFAANWELCVGLCPHALAPRVQIFFCFSVLFVPSLGFTSQPSQLWWNEISHTLFAASSPWLYPLCLDGVAHWEPGPMSASTAQRASLAPILSQIWRVKLFVIFFPEQLCIT